MWQLLEEVMGVALQQAKQITVIIYVTTNS